MKSTWYPQPHDMRGGCSFEIDNTTLDQTIVPFCFYDEGLGAPTARETNPRNASFAVVNDEANCFVNSRVNTIFAEFRFSLTAQALDDNLPSIRFATMPIWMAFKENYTAIDELSTFEIQDILELQTEATDRQGFPLFVAAADLPEISTSRANLGANQPGLDTDVGIEAVAFDVNAYYDMLHYMTNGSMLANSTGGLSWDVLTQQRPFIMKRFQINPKVKRMNEYTFGGLLINFPAAGQSEQTMALAELTGSVNLVHMDWTIRYNEWNEDFNSRML